MGIAKNILMTALKIFWYILKSLFLKLHIIENDGELLRKNTKDVSVTWIGQATCLIQIDGVNILTDPIWAKSLGGIKRYSDPGIKIENLPEIDLILISHAHKDHLDFKSIKNLAKAKKINSNTVLMAEKTVIPLLKKLPGKHISGVSGDCIDFKNIKIHFLAIKHWGARIIFDSHRKAIGFMINGSKNIFFPGDTAYFSGLKSIGKNFNIDIALLPMGDYLPKYRRGVHMSPEDLTDAVDDLNSKTCIPIHWGTFKLSDEDMYMPLKELEKHSQDKNNHHKFRILLHGETFWA